MTTIRISSQASPVFAKISFLEGRGKKRKHGLDMMRFDA